MGTTIGRKSEGESVRAYIVRTEGLDRDYLKIVAHNARGREHYFAIYNARTNSTEVIVVLASKRNGQIAVKVIDEGMGPYYYNASARVVDALSPTSDPTALSWRAYCREVYQKRARLKRAAIGDSVKIGEECYLLVGKQGNTWIGRHNGSGLDYRIGRSAWSRATLV